MPADLHQARELFLQAVKLPPEQWESFVAEACGQDSVLAQQVQRFLQVHREAGSFLESPVVGVARTIDQPLLESPGTQIGPYKLMEQIGEGGMGLVFVAEQQEPVRRKVALKVIKPGMDTRDVIARFEAERQALALMDHPSIARVLDAGATASGRPYFVMELVKGVSITQYCDDNRLTPRERLALFTHVCHAVQHAHQKGIIHRDIKPTNVLVASHDGQPVVKVIDFGVAKAIGQQLTDRTIYTAMAQMIGTPLYMSPEQAGMSSLDIDTRTDIYSLGVLLYELLTGTTPFDKKRLKQAAYDEMRRIIREEEPQKPSTRLSSLGGPDAPRDETGAVNPRSTSCLASIAALRHTEPAKLTKLVRGDLDWIVMKALEKDRNRRYETANGFAMDVQRYLSDEPVLACPPSTVYRFRKFARKNKAALTTAGLLTTALVVGVALSTWQAIRATRAEAQATANEARALAHERAALAAAAAERTARQEEIAQRKQTETERQRAEDNFKKAVEAVDRLGMHVADDSLRNVPRGEQVQKRVFEDTVALYKELLSQRSDDPQLRYKAARSYQRMSQLYDTFRESGERDKYWKLANELFQGLHAEQPGKEQYAIALAYTHTSAGWRGTTAPEREQQFRRAHHILLSQMKDPSAISEQLRHELTRSYLNLANEARIQKQFAEAEQLVDQAAELAAGRDESVPMVINQRVHILRDQERLTEAIDLLEAALRERPKPVAESSLWWAEKYHEYAQAHYLLGTTFLRARRWADAATRFKEAHQYFERLVHDFPSIVSYRQALATTRLDLIHAYQQSGQTADALRMIHELPSGTAEDCIARGKLYESVNEPALALADYQKGRELDPGSDAARDALVTFYVNRARAQRGINEQQALADYERALELSPANELAQSGRINLLMWASPPVKSMSRALEVAQRWTELAPQSAAAWNALANVLEAGFQDHDKAYEAITQALTLDPQYGAAQIYLVEICASRGDFEEALRAAEKVVKDYPKNYRAWHARAYAYHRLGQFQDAIRDYTKALEIHQADWLYLRRGKASFMAGRYDDALADATRAVAIAPAGINTGAWFTPLLVAACPDAAFREGMLRLADKYVEKSGTAAAFVARGSLRAALSQSHEALADMQKGSELAPRSASLHNSIAWFLATSPSGELRTSPLALQSAHKATELEAKIPAYWNTRGVVEYRQGDWPAAVTSLRKSMELRHGGDAFDWFFLAMSYWQLGEQDQALQWQDKAIKWMEKRGNDNEELQRFRKEAEDLIK